MRWHLIKNTHITPINYVGLFIKLIDLLDCELSLPDTCWLKSQYILCQRVQKGKSNLICFNCFCDAANAIVVSVTTFIRSIIMWSIIQKLLFRVQYAMKLMTWIVQSAKGLESRQGNIEQRPIMQSCLPTVSSTCRVFLKVWSLNKAFNYESA